MLTLVNFLAKDVELISTPIPRVITPICQRNNDVYRITSNKIFQLFAADLYKNLLLGRRV